MAVADAMGMERGDVLGEKVLCSAMAVLSTRGSVVTYSGWVYVASRGSWLAGGGWSCLGVLRGPTLLWPGSGSSHTPASTTAGAFPGLRVLRVLRVLREVSCSLGMAWRQLRLTADGKCCWCAFCKCYLPALQVLVLSAFSKSLLSMPALQRSPFEQRTETRSEHVLLDPWHGLPVGPALCFPSID